MQSILITGGSGSFGKSFVRRLLQSDTYSRICIFSRGEHRQEKLAREFAPLDPDGRLRFFVGDVRDRDRLMLAMRGCEVVVHAAAMKVVPKCEADPIEAVKTNIFGTENVIKAALHNDVGKVMFISTDKATAANTLYGATKFAAERMVIAANTYSGGDGPQFACVRYGNVIGSQGSIIPLFKRLVAEGAKSLPLTDPRMTRFFWTLEEAVEFTLSSIGMMAGGEVFIPKIRARRIVDVAREIAPHLPHEIIGIRPAEKLHEVLISEDESRNALELPDRYVLCPFDKDWDKSHLIGAKSVASGFKYSSENAILDGEFRLEAAE